MDYLQGLNEKQKEGVLHTEGPLLILAGAGSGKTRVITHKIAYLIEEKRVFPSNILAITFTNKAAKEMKERVEGLLKGRVEDIWMGTFHSMCVRILRREIESIGYKRNFSIYDSLDQKTLVKECITEKNLNKETFQEKPIINIISSLKDDMIDPDDYINENYKDYYRRNVGEIYGLYEEKLKKNNALDFDDLILKTVFLLKSDERIREKYQSKFEYIFVDEYQDTNKSQYELIKYLSGKHGNICVVGDEDQSVYGWRGADIRNILNFERDFKGAEVIKLEQNYRSTGNILDVANSIIKNNTERKGKKLWTAKERGQYATLKINFDEKEEANFVTQKVIDLIEEGKYKYGDFVILYRTNAQSRSFEETFIRNNIPYKIVGGLKFYDRKEVKDLIAYLRLIQNPLDDISLRRIINVPKRGIGASTLGKIEKYTSQTGESIYGALLDLDKIQGLSGRARNVIKSFTAMINKFLAMKEIMGVRDFIEEVVYSTGYIKELEEENSVESQSRIENLKEFISVAVDFETNYEGGTLEDFLANVSLLSDVDKTDERKDVVTMMTVHGAKGLEFPVVFLVGMEEGLFPISRALDSIHDMEEERRLCYVAVTRAEELLYISYANLRTIYGNTTYSLPSRFLKEIPDDMLKICKNDQRKEKQEDEIEYEERTDIKNRFEKKVNLKEDIQIGSKVNHKMWGMGTVVQIKKVGEDKEIVVAFENKGLKKLLLSIAPIEFVREVR
ncbi:DNA helicase PcrA [Acidilutibacter cellobiosedens]|uniref:ATP-dependent DNA helicase n=1 Tax=Acidilutibacter cellobiosedens TaxID=2507161 RepID=A0A410QA01_9FIRM|nr:DNA helicase PcrA [Acidilutibacter cellobiosedens]MBE6081540.1 DNA helicase PcrA [Tissierellaceae bacterium]QAT60823.1 DNA helicase PcrA [Acidilutibacter cellobiosedens]